MPLPPIILRTIASLLAPFFLQASASQAEAEDAALQALLHHQPETVAEILAAARAIAFSLAALRTLGRAMEPDQTPELAQRLTAAATRLSQSADRAQRSASRPAKPVPPPAGASFQPLHGQRPLTLADAPWADAFADLAADLFTSRPGSSGRHRPPAAPS